MMMYLYDNNKDMIFIFLIVVFPFFGVVKTSAITNTKMLVFISRSIRKFELLRNGLFKYPFTEAKIAFKCPTQFFRRGKISDRDFLHVDRALKTRPR